MTILEQNITLMFHCMHNKNKEKVYCNFSRVKIVRGVHVEYF